MHADAQGFVEGLKRCFAELNDPRNAASCEHQLLDILAIAILAVTCGADDFTDMETFGRLRQDWLKGFLELPGGIPSHDTFRRVFGLLDRKQFAACLFRWTQALHEATGGKLIAVDGKTLRRSLREKAGKAMPHLVTAWASESGLTSGQVACEAKSNEITAIPELLKLLSLKGCTVTIDAMGCQKEIAQQIRDSGGHYVLALKGNQPSLEGDLLALLTEGINTDFAQLRQEEYVTQDAGHGREEERYYQAIEIPKAHRQRALWRGPRTLAVVNSRRVQDGEETWETRLYISSHAPKAQPLAHAIRKHWSIENGQHWVLDIAFGEDARRQQDRNGTANFAAVRRLTVSLLRQEQSLKRGAKCKRMACALAPNYLLKVFHNAKFVA